MILQKLHRLCILIFIIVLINQSFIETVLSQKTFLDNPENLQLYRMLRVGIYKILGSTSTSARSLQRSKQLHKLQDVISKNTSFPCNVKGWRSNVTPTSVHRLKPGDIDIIASMGDSLSAGTGMFGSSLIDLFIDNRGTAAAGGGQDTWREYITLPNIFKEFNPNLYGYSMGDYSTLEKGSKLNIAEAGGMSRDMPYMASILVKRFKSDPHVNLQKHWKHISLMVGSNDFCIYMCTTSADEFLANHERDMVEALRILRDNIPRVFVSLIPPPNLKILINKQINGRPSLHCDLLLDFECPCLFGLLYRNKREEYYKIMERWQEMDVLISKYPEFQKDDFTIMAQPVLTSIQLARSNDGYTDTSFYTVDCFHVSQKTNSIYALHLWNSLLLPYEKKPHKLLLGSSHNFLCPTKKNPYLITYVNEGINDDSK